MTVTIELLSTFFIKSRPCNLQVLYPGHMENRSPHTSRVSTIYSVSETENTSTLINATSVFLACHKGLFTREATRRGTRQYTYMSFKGLATGTFEEHII